VFSVLRGLPLAPRLVGALEAESGLNDAPTVVLVTLISTGSVGEHGAVFTFGVIAFELLAGTAVGLVIGFGGAWLMRRAALPASGLYPLSVLCLSLLAYGAAAGLHASGFAAIYVAALVLGNSELPHRMATRSFAEGLAWLAQIGLFVLLGLLVTPSRLGPALLPALAFGAALLLLARPLSVLASAVWFRVRPAEQVFVSWAGLRGAVPIVLTTIPLTAGVPEARRFFDIVFVIVLVYTLVQGTTLAPLARLLKLSSPSEPRDLEVDSAPLDDLDADLLQVRIPGSSRMHGVLVRELRLPAGAVLSLLVRDGQGMVPGPDTRLRRGDQLLVVTTSPARAAAERRLRAVGRSGRLAGWLEGGSGASRNQSDGTELRRRPETRPGDGR
jgi:cell volume regulation protein A